MDTMMDDLQQQPLLRMHQQLQQADEALRMRPNSQSFDDAGFDDAAFEFSFENDGIGDFASFQSSFAPSTQAKSEMDDFGNLNHLEYGLQLQPLTHPTHQSFHHDMPSNLQPETYPMVSATSSSIPTFQSDDVASIKVDAVDHATQQGGVSELSANFGYDQGREVSGSRQPLADFDSNTHELLQAQLESPHVNDRPERQRRQRSGDGAVETDNDGGGGDPLYAALATNPTINDSSHSLGSIQPDAHHLESIVLKEERYDRRLSDVPQRGEPSPAVGSECQQSPCVLVEDRDTKYTPFDTTSCGPEHCPMGSQGTEGQEDFKSGNLMGNMCHDAKNAFKASPLEQGVATPPSTTTMQKLLDLPEGGQCESFNIISPYANNSADQSQQMNQMNQVSQATDGASIPCCRRQQ